MKHQKRVIVAQDPPPEVDSVKMMEDLKNHPSSNWREYLQPIREAIKLQLGVPVVLSSPRLVNNFVSPQLSFNIAGNLEFPVNSDLGKTYKDTPLQFEAHIGTDGVLHHPIRVFMDVIRKGPTLILHEEGPGRKLPVR